MPSNISFYINNQAPFHVTVDGRFTQSGAPQDYDQVVAPGETRMVYNFGVQQQYQQELSGMIGAVIHSEEYQLYLWCQLACDNHNPKFTTAGISESQVPFDADSFNTLNGYGDSNVQYNAANGVVQVQSYLDNSDDGQWKAYFTFYYH